MNLEGTIDLSELKFNVDQDLRLYLWEPNIAPPREKLPQDILPLYDKLSNSSLLLLSREEGTENLISNTDNIIYLAMQIFESTLDIKPLILMN